MANFTSLITVHLAPPVLKTRAEDTEMEGGLPERGNQPSFKDSGRGTVLGEVKKAHSFIISPDIIRGE